MKLITVIAIKNSLLLILGFGIASLFDIPEKQFYIILVLWNGYIICKVSIEIYNYQEKKND